MCRARLLICGVALVTATAAFAQEGLAVDLDLGLGGTWAGEWWNNAAAIVTNPGPPFDGVLQVEVRGRRCREDDRTPPDASYAMPLRVTTGESHSQFALLLPPYAGSLTVGLTSGADVLFQDRWSLVPDESRWDRLRLPLLIYLGVFAAVMGPVNFFLLRRLRRREGTVVTAPVAAACFLLADFMVETAPMQSLTRAVPLPFLTAGLYVVVGLGLVAAGRALRRRWARRVRGEAEDRGVE